MRDLLFRGGLTVSLLSLLAGGAFAQTPPAQLAGLAGITYEGQIGGLDVWSVPGMTDLFAVTPDGRTLMRGALFSGSGRDLGAALTGSAPDTLLPATDPVVPGSEVSAPALVDEPPRVDTAGRGGFAGMMGPGTCQSPILAEAPPIPVPGVSGWDETGQGTTPSVAPEGPPTDQTGLLDGAQIARTAEDALAGFSLEERRELLLELVNDLRATSTQQGFLDGVAAWRSRIDDMRASKGLPRLYSADGRGVILPESVDDPSATTPPVAVSDPSAVLAPSPITVTPLPPAAEAVESSPAADVTPAASGSAEPSLEQTLLEDVRRNAMWFSVGANDVPAVYAFIDPTCSYSARAISALSEQVGSGQIQLRVVLAPVLSQRSAGLIAAILMSEKPPLAFFDHEVALAERGRSDLEPKAFSTLPAPVQAGIQRNFEMIRDYKIPGVPFFVYETAEGARVVSGAEEGISFPGALVDPYTGTK